MQYLKRADSLFRPLYRLQLSQVRGAAYLEAYPPETKKKVDELLKPKTDPNSYYEGPERDLVNFPRPVRLEYEKPVRLGFIPETWFQAFYSKTGVTGPYLLALGVANLMFSKEYIVLEHEFYQGLNLFIVLYILKMKLGSKIRDFISKKADDMVQGHEDYKNALKNQYVVIKQGEELMQKQAEGQMMIYQAKKENVLLQLEAEYRKRLNKVYTDVKLRLDYMAASEEAKRRMEQNHMVEWIISNAMKSITPQQEKEVMSKCLADLKVLAAKY